MWGSILSGVPDLYSKSRNSISSGAFFQTPMVGAHKAPSYPLAGFKGSYF